MRGEFVCIIGGVGSGKSSLLSSILGDMIYLDKETIDLHLIQNSKLGKAFYLKRYKHFLQYLFSSNNVSYSDDNSFEISNFIISHKYIKYNSYLIDDEIMHKINKISHEKHSDVVKLASDISYVQQIPWIQNKTIRDNILFSSSVNNSSSKFVIISINWHFY